MPDKDKIDRAAEIQKAIDQADERKRADAEATGQKLDKLLVSLDDCVKKIDSLSSRMDSVEKLDDAGKRKAKARQDDDADDDVTVEHSKDDDGELSEEEDHDDDADERGKGSTMPGRPRQVVADRAEREARHGVRMADAQFRADQAAADFGERAPPPLMGETLRAYRIRLLRRFQHHCSEFKNCDLRKITDSKVFDGIESRIFADAKAAGATPDVPVGYLRERVKTDASGRRISEFFANGTSTFIGQLSRHPRYVKSFRRPND